jgi:hypothetical protein
LHNEGTSVHFVHERIGGALLRFSTFVIFATLVRALRSSSVMSRRDLVRRTTFLALVATAACWGQGGEPPAPSAGGPRAGVLPASADVVTRTIVVLRDGARQVREETVPRSVVEREMRERLARTRATAGRADQLEALVINDDTGCAGSSLWLYDGPAWGSYSHMTCVALSGTGPGGATAPFASFTPYPVVSFWPGVTPGTVFHQCDTTQSVACVSQAFPTYGAWTDVSDSSIDSVMLYNVPAFGVAWDGLQTFEVTDDNMDYYPPLTNGHAALTEIPAILGGPVPVNFIWSGDKFSDCWGQGNPGTKCVYGNVLNGGFGSSPPPSIPAVWQPVVGHYQAMNTLSGLTYSGGPFAARCNPQNPPPGCGTCGPLSWIDAKTPGYAFYGYFIDRYGQKESICQSPTTDLLSLEYAYWRVHAGYLLYTRPQDDPSAVATLSPDHALMFNMLNPDVANEIVGRMTHWPGRAGTGYAPYGALSIDTVFLANYSGAHYTCNKEGGCKTCTDPKWGVCESYGWSVAQGNGVSLNGDQRFDPYSCAANDGFCDPGWTQMTLTWIARLRDEAHKLGLNLVVNVGYSGSQNPIDSGGTAPVAYPAPSVAELQKLFGLVDGVLDEGGFTQFTSRTPLTGNRRVLADTCAVVNGSFINVWTWAFNDVVTCQPTPSSATVTEWRPWWTNFALGVPGAPPGYLRAVQALGKPYFNKNDSPNMAGTDSTGVSPLSWSVASHLLARSNSWSTALESIYVADSTNSTSDLGYVSPTVANATSAIYSQLVPYNAAIGHPCEDQVDFGYQVYTRRYSGGFVVVNAVGPSGASAIVPVPQPSLGGPQFTFPSGVSVLTVPPESAQILLPISGSLCP